MNPEKSENLKKLQGTFRPSRANLSANNKVNGNLLGRLPHVPQSFSPAQKKIWLSVCRKLQDNGTLQNQDLLVVAHLCRMESILVDLHIELSQTANSESRHQLRKQINDYSKTVISLYKEFGLTPSTSGKVVKSKKPESKDPLTALIEKAI